MKLGDGLFLQCCKDVAALYPNIEFDQMIVDNTTMQLVSKPQQFDVMVGYLKLTKKNILQNISLPQKEAKLAFGLVLKKVLRFLPLLQQVLYFEAPIHILTDCL